MGKIDSVRRKCSPFTLLLLFLLILPFSTAININESHREFVESKILVLNNDTYFINWSGDEYEYTVTDGNYYGVRRVLNNTFWLREIDAHVSQSIRIIEVDSQGKFTKIGVTVMENPDNPNPTVDVPLHACVNATTIRRANRFVQEHDWCTGDTEYYLERIPLNNEFIIEFDGHPESMSYEWWLGEGQGGIGNGLPTCDGMYASIRLNGSTTANAIMLVGEQTQMSMKASWQGASQYGCSVTSLENQNYNLLPAWRMIPTLSQSNSRLNCTGAICSRSSPAWNVWYNKQVTCDKVGNVSVRVAIFGTAPTKANSPTRNIECRETPPSVEDVEVWFLWLFMALGITGGITIMRKKKDVKKRTKR